MVMVVEKDMGKEKKRKTRARTLAGGSILLRAGSCVAQSLPCSMICPAHQRLSSRLDIGALPPIQRGP